MKKEDFLAGMVTLLSFTLLFYYLSRGALV